MILLLCNPCEKGSHYELKITMYNEILIHISQMRNLYSVYCNSISTFSYYIYTIMNNDRAAYIYCIEESFTISYNSRTLHTLHIRVYLTYCGYESEKHYVDLG